MHLSICLLSIIGFFSSIYGVEGTMVQIVKDNNMREFLSVQWHSEKEQYSQGGIEFDYDTIFTTTPIIFVSVHHVGESVDELASAVVDWCSTESAHVIVKTTSGNPAAVQEANNSYYVTLFALGS